MSLLGDHVYREFLRTMDPERDEDEVYELDEGAAGQGGGDDGCNSPAAAPSNGEGRS